jgi:hypothetical protein
MADQLTTLESDSVYILREAFRKFKNLAMVGSPSCRANRIGL